MLRVQLAGEYLNNSFELALVPQELELALVALEDGEAVKDDLLLHLVLDAQVGGHQRPEEKAQAARLAELAGDKIQGLEVVLGEVDALFAVQQAMLH